MNGATSAMNVTLPAFAVQTDPQGLRSLISNASTFTD